MSEQICICFLLNQNNVNYFRPTAMLKCFSLGATVECLKRRLPLRVCILLTFKSLCVHCEMVDFKHLYWQIITAPLSISRCVCAALVSIQLWAIGSFSKGAGSSKRAVRGSDAADVYLWGELAPTSRPRFRAVLRSNCSWLAVHSGCGAPMACTICEPELLLP